MRVKRSTLPEEQIRHFKTQTRMNCDYFSKTREGGGLLHKPHTVTFKKHQHVEQ